MKKDFKSKYGEWAVVTGASSGIGKALAIKVAQQGINVALVARNKEKLEEVAHEIKEKHSVSVVQIPADLSTQGGIDTLIKQTEALTVGFFVHSAGMGTSGLFTKSLVERELQLIQLNIVSTMALTHHFANKMIERKRGGILLVSSLIAQMSSPYFSNYAASKSYVLNFGNSLYGELKQKGIDVSVLSPGVTQTPMAESTGIDWHKTPVKVMDPEDVAAEAIQEFGKKLSIIPGKENKVMAFLSRRILSFTKASLSNEKMMRKVLSPSKL